MTEPREPREPSGISRLISLQATSLGALILSGFVLLKCYAVAHYSLTTAGALVTASPLSVLLGSIMLYMYQFLPLLGVAALYIVAQVLVDSHSGRAIIVCTAFAAVGVTAIALSPPYYLAWAAGPPVLLVLMAWLVWLRVSRHRPVEQASPDQDDAGTSQSARGRPFLWTPVLLLRPLEWVAVYFVLYTAVVVAVTLPTMWVPTEIVSVSTDHGTGYVIGNVLSDDGRWVTVLRSADHGLSRYPAGDVLARQLCHMPGNQPKHRGPLIDVVLQQHHPSPNRRCVDTLRELRATSSEIMPGSLTKEMLAALDDPG
jgi:hypothetical protein